MVGDDANQVGKDDRPRTDPLDTEDRHSNRSHLVILHIYFVGVCATGRVVVEVGWERADDLLDTDRH